MNSKRIPFRPEDEERIASAALWGTIAAAVVILSMALSTVFVLLNKPPLIAMIPKGLALVLSIFFGVWLIQACTAFRKVALTDVADKAFFLQGCDKLYRYFKILGVVMILLILAFITLAILWLIFGMNVVMSFYG